MAPNQQIRSNSRSPEPWPTRPGSNSPRCRVPPPPTMMDIQDAMTTTTTNTAACTTTAQSTSHEAAAATVEFPDVLTTTIGTKTTACTTKEQSQGGAAAVAVEFPDVLAKSLADISSTDAQQSTHQSAKNGVALPSKFMGYMDEKGVIHKDSKHDNEEKKGSAEEEEKAGMDPEGILEASLNFERSHPEHRYSSSLDNYYSGSVRNLYPSLEDVGQEAAGVPEPPCDESTATYAIATREEDDVKIGLAGTETTTYAIATPEEDDVKIGVARAAFNQREDSNGSSVDAFATASLDLNNPLPFAPYASLASATAATEATVLGNAASETPEEALLAKLAAEDAELVALKRSAYWGGYEGTPAVVAAGDQQATVVSITTEISPNGAVQAELIGEDYTNDAAAAASATGSAAATTASHVTASASQMAVYAVEGEEEPGYAVADSQACVIQGGTSWQAEEATVIQNDDLSVPYSERKLPAVEPQQSTTPQRNNCRFNFPAAVATAADEAEVITVSEDPYYHEAGAAYGTPASSVAYTESAVPSVAYAEGSADQYGAAASVAYAEGAPVSSTVAYAEGSAENGAASSVAYVEGGEGGQVSSTVAYAEGSTAAPSIAYAEGSAEYGTVPSVAYADGAAHRNVSSVAYAADDDEAEVIDIAEDYHPAEVTGNEAQAELIAEDYGDYGAATAIPSNSGGGGDHGEVVGVAEDFHPEEASGSEKYGAASSVAYAEGAPVSSTVAFAQGSAAASSFVYAEGTESSVAYAEALSSVAYADGAAAYGDVACAAAANQLVSEDYGAAIAIQSDGGGVDHGEVVGIMEEYHPAEDTGDAAHAELVGGEIGVAIAQPSSVGVEATAMAADEGGEIQAATVVGFEDEVDPYSSPGMSSRATSYSSPVPERTPPSVRAFTAPAAVGTRIDPVHTPLTQATAELETVVEEDWMRTPSLAGDSSHRVIVMQPPIDGEEEQVAVAVLEAYADAPAPVVDDTNCYSPAGSSQPAVAVASLNAYANAPATPTFDETDCSMVNRQAVQPEIVAQASISAQNESERSAPVEEPAMPPPRSFNSLGTDGGSVGSNSTTTTRAGFQKISNSFAWGMEKLFGDTKPLSSTGRGRSDNTSLAKSIMSRQLLPWSVIYSEASNMWVATVNTNQRALDSKNVVEASKSLRAFSVVTEKQATCLAKAWSPPRMHDFKNNNACHICNAKFAVFRRACHCRNCGVAICVSSNGCSRPWPAKMCPETYNIKKESFLNVCAACDFLCTSFRLALLEGDRDKAVALHATGNINLVTPFANVKGELFYPVHCAALGGNLELLKWLVDENCCPVKSVRVSGRCRDASNSFTEVSTSKGRSLLGIALENRNVGIVRYLVVEKGIQLSGEKDITMDTLCRNLELVLRLMPENASTGNSSDPPTFVAPAAVHDVACDEQAPSQAHDTETNVRGLDTASDGSVSDACIICFDRTIDCVATPCGHQVCCLDCSTNIARCPVCAVECSFMRVFRP